MTASEAWVGPYCDWRKAIAPMGSDSDQLGFAAGYRAGLDAGARGERARAIEECAQIVEDRDEHFFFQRSPDMVRAIIAEKIRALLPPAAPEEKRDD